MTDSQLTCEHDPPQAPPPKGQQRRELTALETQRIISFLLCEVQDQQEMAKLNHGAYTTVARQFHVHPQTIRTLWARARANFANPDIRAFRVLPQKHKYGRQLKWDCDALQAAIRDIPMHQRKSIRALSSARHPSNNTLQHEALQ